MMNRSIFLLPALSCCLLWGCSPVEEDVSCDVAPVSFSLPAEGTTRAETSALPAGSTLRVIAYLHESDDATGYADANRRAECTYQVNAAGLLEPCAVRMDGSVDPDGTPAGEMELVPGKYDFYAITPALRVYHQEDNPMVHVYHGTDFASCVTQQDIIAGANSVTLSTLNRQCVQLKLTTDRLDKVDDIYKIRVQRLLLEELSDEPMWATGISALSLLNNTYKTTVRLDSLSFSVPEGNEDYQQTATKTCLPLPVRPFRIFVEVAYNDETTHYEFGTVVKNTSLTAGSSTNLKLNLDRFRMAVEVTKWTEVGPPVDVFGKE